MSEALLPSIWFFLWGLVWAIYFALDGFNLGVGMLAGFLPQTEQKKLISSLGPFWDGNEVWLITAGGVTFAAFPKLYAVMFSSLYLPLIIILLSLVFRAVAIEFYHQSEDRNWQKVWATTLSVGSFLVALLFGVAFGNIFQGLLLDNTGYHGSIFSLLNPYGILTGILFVLIFAYNGNLWFAYKTGNDKGFTIAKRIYPPLLLAAVLFLISTAFATNLWSNFLGLPLLFVVPLLAVVSLLATRMLLGGGQAAGSLLAGSLTVLLTVITCVIGLFPNMFPSKINPVYSLTAFNASSSPYTLKIMLVVTIIFLPMVLVYQIWHYKLFAPARVDEESPY
ncbi:MAG: cytochrome d ubiquinol oxidase subunit II [Actinomycetota bacterium]|nr:cytochrome d ubiquinol oxidase subunit II [Actinomycetota bacterium]